MTVEVSVSKKKIDLEYGIFGEGKPVVFIHGGGTDYHYHQIFIDELCQFYKVYAFSYPGFGKSSNMKNYTLNNYLELINQFLNKMDLNLVCLVGHSMGAGLAAAYTSIHSNQVDSLILLSPFLYSYKKNIFALANDLSKEGIIEKDYIPAYKNINNSKLSLILSKINKLSKILSLFKLYLFLKNTDISRYLNFTIPTIGVVGEKDLILNPDNQLDGLNKIKNIKILKYSSYGHNVLFIRKQEIVSEIREIYKP